jgi:hypothetical protein
LQILFLLTLVHSVLLLSDLVLKAMMLEASKSAVVSVGTGATALASAAVPAVGMSVALKTALVIGVATAAVGGGLATSAIVQTDLWTSLFGPSPYQGKFKPRTDLWSEAERRALEHVDINADGTDLLSWMKEFVEGDLVEDKPDEPLTTDGDSLFNTSPEIESQESRTILWHHRLAVDWLQLCRLWTTPATFWIKNHHQKA